MALETEVNLDELIPFTRDDCAVLLRETDATGAPLSTGDGVAFIEIGVTNGTEINPVTKDFTKSGDSGRRLVKRSTFEALEVSTGVLQRGQAARNLPRNAQNRFFQFLVVGNEIPDGTGGTNIELWAGWGVIDLGGWKYSLADGEMTGLKISTLSNATSITVQVPSTIAPSATLTIPARGMYITDDVPTA